MTTSRERRAARIAATQKRIEKVEVVKAAEALPPKTPALRMKIATMWQGLANWARGPSKKAKAGQDRERFALPSFPPDVVPEKTGIAQDASIEMALDWAEETYGEDLEFEAFIGFPALAELAQRPEYRRIVETIAQEATRKWIRLVGTGDKDVSSKLKEIDAAFDRFRIRDLFRRTAEIDGFFGRSHIYVDTGSTDDAEELKKPIGDGHDATSKLKVRKGKLQGFRTVEPVWTYPRGGDYNTTNPLSADWYAPQTWLVMGRQVHRTRLLTFVGRPVPDLFKPLYAFGGLSMSQMVKTYVDNWIRTRKSVSDLIQSFSVSGIKVDLADALASGNTEELIARVDAFVTLRDNRNCMVLDKGGGASEPEEFFNISTPLGGLSELQDQAQAQMASICGIPLVKLLGVTPSGLNASSDGEVRTFYDTILAYQERFFRPHLRTILGLIQLDLYGVVDPDIDFKFEPLWSPSEKELAEIRKIDAETAIAYIGEAVIDPLEERTRLAKDENSMYPGLDLNKEIVPPAGENEEIPDLPDDPGREDGEGGENPEDDGDPATEREPEKEAA